MKKRVLDQRRFRMKEIQNEEESVRPEEIQSEEEC